MLTAQVLAALLAALSTVCTDGACDGFDQLRFMLKTNQGGLADALTACVAPLLFGSNRWLPSDQARDFCSQEACQRAVTLLKQLPSCTWQSEVPSGSDANSLSIAQQVLRECASASSK
jgi:DNA polymerase III delta subunit